MELFGWNLVYLCVFYFLLITVGPKVWSIIGGAVWTE